MTPVSVVYMLCHHYRASTAELSASAPLMNLTWSPASQISERTLRMEPVTIVPLDDRIYDVNYHTLPKFFFHAFFALSCRQTRGSISIFALYFE